MRSCVKILSQNKIAIFVVLYNSEKFIDNLLGRIPMQIRDKFVEIFIIDDSSSDKSYLQAIKSAKKKGFKNIRILRTPYNRGYGGNQKLGYLYAIKKKFDIVILLHGDGQYAPELLPNIIVTLKNKSIDALIGSRMINKFEALKGNMPFYKWIGNIILTFIENKLLNTNFSEFHSGYRAYRISTLSSIPFEKNTDDFHFDTEILIQLIEAKKSIKEIRIPTYYGKEICHVNGLTYAFNCIKAVIKYKITRLGLLYEPNYDIQSHINTELYRLKKNNNTLHQYIINQKWEKNKVLVDLGSNHGEISKILAEKINKVVSVDKIIPDKCGRAIPMAIDLNSKFENKIGISKFDVVLALDVIEHLDDSEKVLKSIFKVLKPSGKLFASTGNIAYFVTRMSLFLGMFNYGKKGILDKTHKHLFTINSFNKLLNQNGFRIKKTLFFGPPIIDEIADNIFFKIIDRFSSILAQVWPTLFCFNFLVEAERIDSLDEIYSRTFSKKL
ncbi:MAG: bifunctional glycosyltransferase/class I SAM-dependent methyltransferase [Cyanobacteria bacterium]|nr:bifunctional glycosyltransferase/class I SAM-dependent methyltransferase [Cyanobacteriota bacterium]